MDIAGNELVEFEEFLLLLKLQNCDPKQLVREAFKVLDPEDNGVITADSLQTVCADLGLDIPRDQMEDMVAQVDPEGTGQVHIQGMQTKDFTHF